MSPHAMRPLESTADAADLHWEAEERTLRREVGEPPLDEGVVELVIALRLLGFPTDGSCFGHLEREYDAHSPPWVSCSVPLASRFAADGPDSLGARIWSSRERLRVCSRRERHYLALLVWMRYRPLAQRLRGLLADFYAGRGRPSPLDELHVAVSVWGVVLEPRAAARLSWDHADGELETVTFDSCIERWQGEMRAIGTFLHALALADSRSGDS